MLKDWQGFLFGFARIDPSLRPSVHKESLPSPALSGVPRLKNQTRSNRYSTTRERLQFLGRYGCRGAPCAQQKRRSLVLATKRSALFCCPIFPQQVGQTLRYLQGTPFGRWNPQLGRHNDRHMQGGYSFFRRQSRDARPKNH